ncbi:MAG: septum formation family protein [Pseudoclavibacter sp.]|nr:septum formation family protein [Pseudoclavibacter sp.]
MSITTLARRACLATTAITASLLLAGCSLLSGLGGAGGPSAERGEDGAVETAGNESVFSIKVGDCLQDPGTGSVSDVQVIPCDQEHDMEVYAELELPAGELPADLDQQAEAFCVEQFASFVGVPYEESTLDATWFTPTQQGWESGDRLVNCLVFDPQGATTGSLSGASR